MSKSNFISTTIPYVNARPHVGFALELTQTDALARYRSLIGNSVYLQTGTDENSLKNVLAARKVGIPVQAHVDSLASVFHELSSRLGVKHDRFIRTSSPAHSESVESFWRKLSPDDLYLRSYSGLYCVGCEDYLNEADLQDGLCPDHRQAPELLSEENIFFRLSKYQGKIHELISSDQIQIVPSTRKKEILRFIENGLQDISVSRHRDRSGGWGIPVPGHDDQIIYVWIDALINYVTGVGSDWDSFDQRIHVIGKNVWKFHAIYWPALLLSAGLSLPDEIVIHGFLTLDGNKISKSLGNTVDPLELVETYSSDSLRFYLLKCFSPFEDGDFSTEVLRSAHNAYLVNGLGNLVSRLFALSTRVGGIEALHAERTDETGSAPVLFPTTEQSDVAIRFCEAVSRYRWDDGARVLWSEIDRINAEISSTRPWEFLASESNCARLEITRWLKDLRCLTPWLGIYLPDAAQAISKALREPGQVPEHLFERLK